MRVRRIRIEKWRHFENITLEIDTDVGLVCIVGANGTGKSHLLELIAACAHELGLSQGVEIPRGNPFADNHKFSLEIYLSPGVSGHVDEILANDPSFHSWDRTIVISSEISNGRSTKRINAGGISDQNEAQEFASRVVDSLRQSKDVHFLSLDADRAYPKKNINFNEIAQAYEIDWETEEYTRGRSFRATSTLYDEWIKFFLAQENQSGTKLIQKTRRARANSDADPVFEDHFKEYREALLKVLPHVSFTGVDPKQKTLLFDTTGIELTFNQLSGGEREIAFLIGQIDRFALRQGLFLLDEPELHLNADLIRAWIGYLVGTVETGQIWLATHSLEAVEATGQTSTFVLERNETTKKVDKLARLDKRPVLSALSRAVGTPAFSISKLRFVFIEGEESVGERERFRQVAGLPSDVRFIACGSCNEVIRRVQATQALSNEAEQSLRIGGVIDRDYQTNEQVVSLQADNGIYVLPVHELENFFLYPETLQALISQNGVQSVTPHQVVKDTGDTRAGSWVFQNAMAYKNAKSLPEISSAAKDRAKRASWSDFEMDSEDIIQEIVNLSNFENQEKEKLKQLLEISVDSYKRKRADKDTFWKICEGKQILKDVAVKIGYSGVPALVQASFTIWNRREHLSQEMVELRNYIEKL